MRRFPKSGRHPHFNKSNLVGELKENRIEYRWMGEPLGGYRSKGLGEGSPNGAWNSEGFQNYADHALSEKFQRALDEIVEMGEEKRVAIMCAERLFWKCHRRIICDWLSVKGREVVHILDRGDRIEHNITDFAEVKEGKVTYPEG